MSKVSYFLWPIGVVLILSGCSHNSQYIERSFDGGIQKCEENLIDGTRDCITKPYQGNHKVIVGSVQDDSRIVYSTGKILKTWIAPYYQGETLISAHSNYIVVEKPRFIVGESVMREGRIADGAKSPTGALPMAYRDEELDRTPIPQQYSNRNVQKYTENVEKSKVYSNIPAENRINKASGTYDKEIQDYIRGR